MATAEYHLRCADTAKEHFDDDGQQGFADGDFDAEGAASAGGEDVAQDLPGKNRTFYRPLHELS